MLAQTYKEKIIPALQKELKLQNVNAVPKITKVVVNIGTGRAIKDPKLREVMAETLQRITGQKPSVREAKKSIAAFKIREGLEVGLSVTLHGRRMYDFLEKLIHVTLPRVRDFRGLKLKSIDKQGNLTIGFKEHMAFPEIKLDEVEKVHGLEVALTTTAKDAKEAQKLFELIGLPFRKDEKKKK